MVVGPMSTIVVVPNAARPIKGDAPPDLRSLVISICFRFPRKHVEASIALGRSPVPSEACGGLSERIQSEVAGVPLVAMDFSMHGLVSLASIGDLKVLLSLSLLFLRCLSLRGKVSRESFACAAACSIGLVMTVERNVPFSVVVFFLPLFLRLGGELRFNSVFACFHCSSLIHRTRCPREKIHRRYQFLC